MELCVENLTKVLCSRSLPALVVVIIFLVSFSEALTTITSTQGEPIIEKGPSNKTVVIGDTVIFSCLTSGDPQPSVSWQRDGRSLHHNGHATFQILDSGALLLENVGQADEGSYHCIARNDKGVQYSETARLVIDVPPYIKGGRTVYNVTWGSLVELVCSTQGAPPPIIVWFREGKKLPTGKPEFFHSILSFTATESASFTCQAVNKLRSTNQTQTDSKEFTVHVLPKPEPEEEVGTEELVIEEEIDEHTFDVKTREPQGYCSPYVGKVCRKYLNNSGLVYYNFSDTTPGINEEITRDLWEELISSLMEPCRTAAEQLLCAYAFPQCQLVEGFQTGKELCREDCIAVRELFCYNQWAQIEDNKERGIYFQSRGHFRLPQCESLPSQGNSPVPLCSWARLTEMKEDEITTECIFGRGRYYQGTVNITKSGISCQRWDSQEPHKHHRPPLVFPEVLNSENFCRNAGGEEPRPWCYTMDPMVRWQHCDIPKCENATVEEETKTELLDTFEPPEEPVFTPSFILIVCAVSLTGVAVVLAIFLCCRRLHKFQKGYNATPTAEVEIDLDKLPSNMSYHKTDVQLNPKLENLEYPRNDIIYICDIGQGAFGRVFQAKAPGLVKGEEFTMIAVKMLKEEASEDLQTDFEREACLLADFDHPNIVKLLGVCAIGKPMCLLFEFMGKGDLNEFLRSCAPSNYIVRTPNCDMFSDVRLSHLDLVSLAKQIAAGMVYLSDRKFVHRDLATRNCLVSDDMVVKISDFGLSQKIYTSNYYKGNEHDAIPIRWMPIESILFNKFTVESDVWAFGVVLWEVFSFGLQPYYGLTHEEVVKYVQEGNILSCQDNTPSSIYNLMKNCWTRKPSNRPSFKFIYKTLTAIHDDMAKYQDKVLRAHV
ncbi:tyrosine-protein kinase transmembrane receptor Ror2-like [Limulus polyphemus]|uniref:receptor protein-tyrosine kinase n=1 Tax=Limulus polyphemus TaxID=6850 RepID=A0ABM1C4Z5_LIMPO|nr:tyrosine-protein kinase transmembrane receptor Ror2-like [Limulus polyphemus]